MTGNSIFQLSFCLNPESSKFALAPPHCWAAVALVGGAVFQLPTLCFFQEAFKHSKIPPLNSVYYKPMKIQPVHVNVDASTKLVLQINENQPAHGNVDSSSKLVLQINENQPAHGIVDFSTKLVLQIKET